RQTIHQAEAVFGAPIMQIIDTGDVDQEIEPALVFQKFEIPEDLLGRHDNPPIARFGVLGVTPRPFAETVLQFFESFHRSRHTPVCRPSHSKLIHDTRDQPVGRCPPATFLPRSPSVLAAARRCPAESRAGPAFPIVAPGSETPSPSPFLPPESCPA